MIYAGIDVNIATHPKALAAGVEALGLWTWGMCHAQLHETNGTLTRHAVLAAMGGRRNVMLAKRLVEAGLWIAHEDGSWSVWNYGKKNQSADEIRRKKALAAERTQRWRRGKCDAQSDASVTAPVTQVKRIRTDPSPEPSPSLQTPPPPPPSPVSEPVTDLSVPDGPTEKPSRLRYREAYCAGVANAKGSPYAWPPGPATEYADTDLGLAIATFAKSRSTGKALRGDVLTGWIQAAAEDFVGHVLEAKDDPKFWSHFAPKGLVRYLNQAVMADEAQRVG